MPETIGIIGGTGKMGQAFQRFFEERGHRVLVAGRTTALSPAELARAADIVIVSVPIGSTTDTIRKIGPHLRPEALLMDFTSLKKAPLEAMLEAFSGAVVGAHPVFGPTNVVPGETVVLCAGRDEKWYARIKEIFADFRLVEMTADEHDQAMALVQGLQHFLEAAYAATMAEIGIPLPRLLDVASPVYRIQMDLVGRIIGHDADLYAEIVYGTDAAQQAIGRFAERCAHIAGGGKECFLEAFAQGKRFFGDFTVTAQQRSDEMILRLSENEVEKIGHAPADPPAGAVGVLGPALTWSDLAAARFLSAVPRQLYPSFGAIFAALAEDKIEKALFPIENKITGAIRPVYEEISARGMWIETAFDLPIDHVLAARSPEPIKTIYGHEQSLAQCRRFLETEYPAAALIATTSNSEAVRRAAMPHTAAICSTEAAAQANFSILAKNIADRGDNLTRFGLVRKRLPEEQMSGEHITTLRFELKNEPGSLLGVLQLLAGRQLNMVRLESVPTGRKFSEYAFYLDFEGELDAGLHAALTEKTATLQTLGHYSVVSAPSS
jgi:prephenate dehydratase/prephenate dehydrogenase